MDTQKDVETLETAGIDTPHAKAFVQVVKAASDEHPTHDRVEKLATDGRLELRSELMAFRKENTDSRSELHRELSAFRKENADGRLELQRELITFRKENLDFRLELQKQFNAFQLRVTWFLVGSLASAIVALISLIVNLLRH